MLFKIISNGDDQLVAVKITLSLRSYFFRPKNAMAALSAAMVAFNSIYPVFSGAGPVYGAPTRRRPRPSTRTLSVELIRRARHANIFIKRGKTLIATNFH
jgi:hypothetical protein